MTHVRPGPPMRRLLLPAILVAIPFIEVAVTVLMTEHLGPARTYGLFAVPTAIGLFLQWLAWSRLKVREAACPDPWKKYRHFSGKRRSLALQNDPDYPAWLALHLEKLLFWVSTVLLLIPGVITDLLGFALMLSPLRARLLEPT